MANVYNYAGAGFSGAPGGYAAAPGVQNFITPNFPNINAGMQTFPNINAGMPAVNWPQVTPNNPGSGIYWGPQTEIPVPQPGQSLIVSPFNPTSFGSNVQWGEQRVLYQPTVQLPPGVEMPDVTPGLN